MKPAKFIVTDLKSIQHIPMHFEDLDEANEYFEEQFKDELLNHWVIMSQKASKGGAELKYRIIKGQQVRVLF